MSDTEIKRLRRIEKLARRLLKDWNHPLAYAHCKEMAAAYRGSTTPIQLSNAVMRDLLEEFME